MDYEKYLRPHIRDMEPYTPILPFEILSEQLGIPTEEIIKLDANENPYGPIPEVADVLAELPNIHIYPDPESRILRQAIAQFIGVSSKNILAGAGADELIDLIMRMLLEPEDCILNCPPTFGMYRFDAEINAAQVVNVPRRSNFQVDLENVIANVEKFRPKIIFLASPNNPDGSLITDKTLKKILDLPIIVVVDEAYIEFAVPSESLCNMVQNHKNLIVLRTFSKWPGLAGLRVGYGVFPDWMMPHLWKIKQPYNVSVAGSVTATTSLANIDKLHHHTGLIISERQRLYEGLSILSWLEPYPSNSNFILCKVTKQSASEVKDHLAKQGIFVRYFDKPGLSDHIRISVGKPEHTDRLLEALESIQ